MHPKRLFIPSAAHKMDCFPLTFVDDTPIKITRIADLLADKLARLQAVSYEVNNFRKSMRNGGFENVLYRLPPEYKQRMGLFS